MCSIFLTKIYAPDGFLALDVQFPSDQNNFDLRVHGYMKTEKAPVIFANEKGKLELRPMCFSLCPTWSKEFPAKFSTYNARMERPNTMGAVGEIERIYQVPTWRNPFTKGQTCLVPMTGAIESSYFGSSAGHIIQFLKKDLSLFYVAGLWSQWVDKKTGEVHDTFTLLTDNPYKFFFNHGHDRSVVVIDESKHEQWLLDKTLKPEARFNLIRDHRISLDWDVKIDRAMKSGWQKRAPTQDEIQNIQVWG